MDSSLTQKHCVPCEGGTVPMFKPEAEEMMTQVPEWQLWPDGKMISREFTFKNFADAFAFATKVAAIAEEEQHHPDMLVGWGKVGIELSTHAIGGLSENDFILAAKIDAIHIP